MRLTRSLLVALGSVALLAAPLAAADCAMCHPAEAKLHLASAHASALVAPAASAFFRHLPGNPLGEGAGGYLFDYRQTGGGVDVVIERGADRVVAPVVWIFGAGRQGQTPVVYYQGHFIEHRVSLYIATGYGITIGHENRVSRSAVDALGLVETDTDARSCFNCHATSASDDLTKLVPGVQCLRCHAGAEEHALGRGMPVNPGKLDHAAQVTLCGTCHRLKPPSGDEGDAANVRFQPLRLMKSACFRNSDIKCTTCHPAHLDAQRDSPETYNRRCRDCHARYAAHAAHQRSGNCIGCHMPQVSPAPQFTFTDHFIRVVHDK